MDALSSAMTQSITDSDLETRSEIVPVEAYHNWLCVPAADAWRTGRWRKSRRYRAGAAALRRTDSKDRDTASQEDCVATRFTAACAIDRRSSARSRSEERRV